MKTKQEWLDSQQWLEVGEEEIGELIEKVQADARLEFEAPHLTVQPEVFFFGCIGNGERGHYLKSKLTKIDFKDIPWGTAIDWGLLEENSKRKAVSRIFLQTDGWTIISFEDRTGDSRPGSNSAFFAHAILSLSQIQHLARAQWPELANRIPPDHTGLPPWSTY